MSYLNEGIIDMIRDNKKNTREIAKNGNLTMFEIKVNVDISSDRSLYRQENSLGDYHDQRVVYHLHYLLQRVVFPLLVKEIHHG